MKYLKLFEKDTDYQSFITGRGVSLPNVSYTVDENKVYYKPLVNQTIKYIAWSQNIITPNDGAFLDVNGNKLSIIKNELETNFEPHFFPANMVINGELYELSSSAFSNVEDLRNITLPKTLQIINDYAFANCTSITSVVVPISITKIPPYCFQNCTNIDDPGAILFNINGEDSSIREIGEYAFDGGRYYSISIPKSVAKIGEGAFQSLSNEYYPTLFIDSINKPLIIGEFAFSGYDPGLYIVCNATIPPTLAKNTFENSNIISIEVPKELIETYKTADGWSNYADIIGPIQE